LAIFLPIIDYQAEKSDLLVKGHFRIVLQPILDGSDTGDT
ncbi:MAG: hypothetical protein K0R47_5522, partial [Brevibacillus sp.]|nr:hypothetical protein [Brevibacillus sp.]